MGRSELVFVLAFYPMGVRKKYCTRVQYGKQERDYASVTMSYRASSISHVHKYGSTSTTVELLLLYVATVIIQN